MSESIWSGFLRRLFGQGKVRGANSRDEVTPASTFPLPVNKLTEIDRSERPFRDGLEEIQGVVSPSSQGAGGAKGGYRVQIFSLAAWRRMGQPLVRKKLIILRAVRRDDEWLADFPECTIRRLTVQLSEDDSRAVFASELKLEGEDPELTEIAAELRLPVVVSTSRFGELTLDRSVGWFEGSAEWNGVAVKLYFNLEEVPGVGAASAAEGPAMRKELAVAEQLWDAQKVWAEKVQDFAIERLLPLKNEHWLGDDEEPVTAEQFLSRMKLLSLSFEPDGAFEFFHEDGQLFGEHAISIAGSLEDGLTDADIPG